DHVRADDTHFTQGRAGRQATGALKQIGDPLRPLIRNRVLKAMNFADKIDLLTVVSDYPHLHVAWRKPRELGNPRRGFRSGSVLDALSAELTQINAAISGHAILGIQLRAARYSYFENIGTADVVMLSKLSVLRRRRLFGHEGLFDLPTRRGAARK